MIESEGLPYIGSTKQMLSARMATHKSLYKRWKNGKYHYFASFDLFEKYGIDNCKNCRIKFANYHCNKCNLWSSNYEKAYHCDGCKVCKYGRKSDYTHCYKCNQCYSNKYFNIHKCNISNSECPICLESLLVIYKKEEKNNINIGFKCSHYYHKKCYDNFLTTIDTDKIVPYCPLCKKSTVQTSDYEKKFDEVLSMKNKLKLNKQGFHGCSCYFNEPLLSEILISDHLTSPIVTAVQPNCMFWLTVLDTHAVKSRD
jgi:hypothetical protein